MIESAVEYSFSTRICCTVFFLNSIHDQEGIPLGFKSSFLFKTNWCTLFSAGNLDLKVTVDTVARQARQHGNVCLSVHPSWT